ncbi:cytosolic protein, partial [Lacticaseibacillus rhamnosus MTCC 5462]
NIQREEIAFTLDRLLKKSIGDVTPIMGHHLAEVTVPKLERQAE